MVHWLAHWLHTALTIWVPSHFFFFFSWSWSPQDFTSWQFLHHMLCPLWKNKKLRYPPFKWWWMNVVVDKATSPSFNCYWTQSSSTFLNLEQSQPTWEWWLSLSAWRQVVLLCNLFQISFSHWIVAQPCTWSSCLEKYSLKKKQWTSPHLWNQFHRTATSILITHWYFQEQDHPTMVLFLPRILISSNFFRTSPDAAPASLL